MERRKGEKQKGGREQGEKEGWKVGWKGRME